MNFCTTVNKTYRMKLLSMIKPPPIQEDMNRHFSNYSSPEFSMFSVVDAFFTDRSSLPSPEDASLDELNRLLIHSFKLAKVGDIEKGGFKGWIPHCTNNKRKEMHPFMWATA